MNDYEKAHQKILRQIGAECAVLLQSDGTFPIGQPCDLALYGNGARRTIKGGTGSGEVNSRHSVTVEEGLLNAGFRITTKSWLDCYDELYAAAKKRFIRDTKRAALKRGTLAIIDSMGAVMPEPDYDLPTDGKGDTAVYVLSRISGEGSDRRPVPGDILLSETEIRDILKLNETYKRFLLVLNVGGVVDLSPVLAVKNILLISQLGDETGNVCADLLLGKSVPSGKLTTTWSAWGDYQTVGQFGEKEDTRYKESVYVGYRYFDAVEKQPLFPFGFGLGYTSFALSKAKTSEEDGRITCTVTVKNTGARSGKEVVQLYVSAPQGTLDKPYQSLAAFAKTDELKPGEAQTVSLSFDMKDLASYDEETASWILEGGDYVLKIGVSSRDTKDAAVIRLDGEARVKQVKNCLGTVDFTDYLPVPRKIAVSADLPVIELSSSAFRTETVNYELQHPVEPVAETMSDEELCLLGIGLFRKKGAASAVGNAAQSVAGAAGETVAFPEKHIPMLLMADGPAGLRLCRQYTKDEKGVHGVGSGLPESVLELMPVPAAFFMKLFEKKPKATDEILEQNCSAIPIGTAVAQSWNVKAAEQCGDIVGDEMERFNIHLWLAPALNIHRDVRCGRNYEYFSEDPLLSGKMAAAITLGVQSHPGCGTTIKHFVANNQETNRYNNNSMVSERAMREIYLRGFEIAVRESQPLALMTSYNLLNGVHTSERRDLIEDVLRAEFGYQGVVMTDWIIAVMTGPRDKYAAPDASKIAAAGNDITMPGGKGDLTAMKKGLLSGILTREQLEINASRIIRLARMLQRN